MKTLKRILTVGLFLVTITTMANDKVITAKERDVTITSQEKQVQISILNTKQLDYTLRIYNGSGELIHSEVLGSDRSLGRVFDFSNALRNTYTFAFDAGSGERFQYYVKTGSW